MMHFLVNCLQPDAATNNIKTASGLFGYALPRSQESWLWILWVFVAILAIVAWVILVGG